MSCFAKGMTFLILSFVAFNSGMASWPTEIDEAITFPGLSYGRFCEDGEGGAWIAGENLFGEIYVTRISRSGEVTIPNWVSIGGLYDGQFSSGMFMSEDSCLIIGYAQYEWRDTEVPKGYGYVQKVDRNGNRIWPEGGIQVTLEESSAMIGGVNAIPEICTDGRGGVYVSWLDRRHNEIHPALYSQHINSAGDPEWGVGGVESIHDNIGAEWNYIYSTPDSLCIVGATSPSNGIRYLKLSATGETLFELGESEGLEGTLIKVDADHNYYLLTYSGPQGTYIRKVSSVGEPLWGESGVLIRRTALGGPGRQAFVDNQGGFFFTWIYGHTDPNLTSRGSYFQWVSSEGFPYFEEEQRISTSIYPFHFSQSDSSHMMFVQNEVVGNSLIVYSQRVSSSGDHEWPDSTIIHIQNGQSNYALGPENVSDGNGGEIVFFQTAFLEAKQVSRDGTIGDITVATFPEAQPITPKVFNCTAYPNPCNSAVTLKLDAYPSTTLLLNIYNLRGKRVHVQELAKSQSLITITLSDQIIESGVYVAQLTKAEELVAMAKFTLLK